ncbi:MAG: hypothetical protein E7337_07070 [Clostridiales bacterium]|nr:hypothetical protein [Clostridiales bacterium]
MAYRAYVKVIVSVDEIGKVRPLSIEWEDGRVFYVDRLLDVRRAASTKVGGQGMRYTLRIMGRETYLFEDEGRWFVEARDVPRQSC